MTSVGMVPPSLDADIVLQMPEKPDCGDTDAVLSYLGQGLDRILSQPNQNVDIPLLVGLYSTIHDYSTSPKASSAQNNGGRSGGQLPGESVYKFLKRYISQCIGQVNRRLQPLSGTPLLESYFQEWTHFTDSAHTIDRVFRYLNRHWVKRQAEDGEKVYNVYCLHLYLWHQELLCPLSEALTDGVEKLIAKRDETITAGPVKDLIEFTATLEINDTGLSGSLRDIYKGILEVPIRKVLETYPKTVPSPAEGFCESWVCAALDKKLSQPEVQQRLIAIFYKAKSLQRISESSSQSATVKLVSNDLVVFEAEQRVAEFSFLISNLYTFIDRETLSTSYIPLPNLDSKILAKVLEWCNKHKNDLEIATHNENGWDQRNLPTIEVKLNGFDGAFWGNDPDSMTDMIRAANYLDIKPLLDEAGKAISNLIRGKSPSQIRQIFKITNDFTPHEEAQVQQGQ